MNTPLASFALRLLAGFGTAALVAAVGLFASSRPAHTAGGPIAVNVANTVQNRDVDGPTRQPVETFHEILSTTPASDGDTLYTVPAGKRLVVESVSILNANTPDSSGFTAEVRRVSQGSDICLTAFPVAPGGGPTAAVTQPMRLYAEAGDKIVLNLIKTGSGSFFVYACLYGYLVDVP